MANDVFLTFNYLERERDRERQEERETQNPQQAPGSELSEPPGTPWKSRVSKFTF